MECNQLIFLFDNVICKYTCLSLFATGTYVSLHVLLLYFPRFPYYLLEQLAHTLLLYSMSFRQGFFSYQLRTILRSKNVKILE